MIRNQKIRYGKKFKILRKIIKYFLSLLYPIIIKIYPLPKVLSIEETIKKIIDERLSLARFGDGEFLYIIDKLSLPFQDYNYKLANSLKTLLKIDDTRILVGLPIGYYSLKELNRESQLTWRSQIVWIYPRLRKYLNLNKIYANASISRLYIEYEDIKLSRNYFEMIKGIWQGKDIIIVEGEKSRLGVGNDLFENAKTVKRILAPAVNAYEKFTELIDRVSTEARDKLILLALGPTAKPLAYELTKLGFQVVDIGNLDIEYEWYLRGAKEKIKIPGKYTSEAPGGRTVEEIEDESYSQQIIARII